jgi:two-component system sensor histidine kinase DegS
VPPWGSASEILWRGAAILVVVLGIALGMGAGVARNLARPLQELTRGVEAVAAGDFEQRVEVRTADEVGRLAWGFNEMSRSLAEMAAGLHQARRELEAKALQLQELLQRTVVVQEEERRRIASDLHDGLLQLVVGALGGVQAARRSLEQGLPALASLELVEGLLKEIVAEARTIIFVLRPPRLEAGGLAAALAEYGASFARAHGIRCSVITNGSVRRLPAEAELGIYRVVQEALQNVAKHARATEVEIRQSFLGPYLELTVRDNGRGFSLADADPHSGRGKGLGLLNMKERIEALGGSLHVSSAPGRGTTVLVRFPLERGEGS